MDETTDQASEETEGATADTADTSTTTQSKKVGTNDAINGNLDDVDDVDTLKGMVKALRVENGNHRRKNKDLQNEYDSLKVWKLDHAKGLADADEKVARADAIAKRYVIRAAALELGVDDDLVDLIDGNSEEEIWEKAEKLANTKKPKDDGARNPLDPAWVPGPTKLMPGKRGNPVTKPKAETSDSDWLREAWNR